MSGEYSREEMRDGILRVLYRRAHDNGFMGLFSLAEEIAVELKVPSSVQSRCNVQEAVQLQSGLRYHPYFEQMVANLVNSLIIWHGKIQSDKRP